MRTAAIVTVLILCLVVACQVAPRSWPRPEGVPNTVSAGFTALNGVTWAWCEDTASGSIRWRADKRLSMSLAVYPNLSCRKNRKGDGRVLVWPGGGGLRFPFDPSEPAVGGGRPCPFEVSASDRAGMTAVLAQAASTTTDPRRRRLLAEANRAMGSLDGKGLVTELGGFSCAPMRELGREGP